MNSFAEKLKEYRKDKKLTQTELAEQLGIAKSVISDIESGRRVASKKTLSKLAQHSGIAIDWWMDGIEGYENLKTEELSTTKMIINKLIDEGLLKDGNIDDDIANILLNSLRVDIELKFKKK